MSTIINATTTNGVVIQPDNSGSLVLQTNNGTTALTISTAQDTTLAGKLTTASSGIQFSDASIQTAAASPYVLKNRIINGDMRIDQRNAGASYSAIDGGYSLDRWRVGSWDGSSQVTGKYTVQQNAGSVTPPAGFVNYLGITSSAATTVGSGAEYILMQFIEGYNMADLDWGTANAKTVTLSFWVRSSLTGTFGGSLLNSSVNYSYPFSYSIPTANTWTQISITITGATSGTWVTTNGLGIRVIFGLGVGSSLSGTAGSWSANRYESVTGATNVVSTNGATWYVTGVQLEQNTSATPFERRLYGTELALCQRYCPVFDISTGDQFSGNAANTTLSDYNLSYKTTTRVAGTGITASGTFGVSNFAGGFNASAITFQASGTSQLAVRLTTTAGSPSISQGIGTVMYSTGSAKIIVTGCEL